MQVLVGEGIHVRSSGQSKGDIISMIVVTIIIIIISSKQDYSTSSLRVNLEETEAEGENSKCSCSITNCSAMFVSVLRLAMGSHDSV